MADDKVRSLQAALKSMGYDPGALDGLDGPKTRAAAAAFGGGAEVAKADTAAPAHKLDARSETSLRGVHPDLVRIVRRAAEISPVKFTVIEGLRTKARQADLVKAGASKTMNSRHITGHAVDLVPHRPDGVLAFDWPLYHILAPAMKQAASELAVPLVWGGDWASFRDGPHFELDRKKYPG